MVKVMFRASLTLTTPATEMGLMPKSVCLMRKLARSRSTVAREPVTETGAVTDGVTP